MNNKPLLTKDAYLYDPFPNPDIRSFHGKWTDWPELHNQKSLKKDAVYALQHNSKVPECGVPFFVSQTHPSDGGEVRLTDKANEAKKFRGIYLLRTMWNWELWFTAVPL